MRRTLDTEALAAAFPFTSPDLPSPDPVTAAAPEGVLYGYNLGSSGLVHWDRFAPPMHNHNSVILARSGAGKSYLAKLELLPSLHCGVHAAVIDPEDEYSRLAHAVGGRVLPDISLQGRQRQLVIDYRDPSNVPAGHRGSHLCRIPPGHITDGNRSPSSSWRAISRSRSLRL